MPTKIHAISTLLYLSLLISSLHCFSNLKEIKKEPFNDRIGSYSKYLKTSVKKPSENLKSARIESQSKIQITKQTPTQTRLKRSKLGAIQSLSLEYFRNLHKTFMQNIKIFRFWIQFLKLRPELGLKEFKIRTQQLRNVILQGTEASIQTREQLIKVSDFMKDLSEEIQNNSIEFIETPYYSKLITSQSRVRFLTETLGFYVDHVATLQTYHLNNLVKELDSIIHQVESINGKHWEKSFESILLRDQAILITEIKKLTREKLKGFRQVKQNYIYAESQILINRDEIKPTTLPSSRIATRAEVFKYRNLQKSFLEKITKFVDEENIQFQILKHNSARSEKWLSDYPRKDTQPLIPLANQLFQNNNSTLSVTKSKNNKLKNRSQVSTDKNHHGMHKSTNLGQMILPDWI